MCEEAKEQEHLSSFILSLRGKGEEEEEEESLHFKITHGGVRTGAEEESPIKNLKKTEEEEESLV